MGNDAEFDVFLCHNSEDKEAVIEIAEQLEECGVRPWLDEWELRPGLSWQFALEQQIEQIATAAVFVGETGIGPWQQQEIYAFLNEFVRRNCPVIPVILKNAPKRPALPIFLKNNTWVDFRRQRPDPMGRLTWGVTGKKPARKRKPVVDENTPPATTSVEERKGSANPETPNSAPAEVELVSAVGMDYGKLRDFLAAGQWKEADRETLRVMLAVAKREQQGWLDSESIENFPCEDLRTIDRLWVKHSDGRFGFSVQKTIWEGVGGNPEAGMDEWRSFSDRVAWRVDKAWLNYSDLTFGKTARLGHLPAGPARVVDGGGWFGLGVCVFGGVWFLLVVVSLLSRKDL